MGELGLKRDIFLGRHVAVYRIDEFLGEGGFAFVYKARDTNLDIDVALKILKPAFAYDEVFEQNFRREAHRAAKFRHPNVVAIHYAGKDDDVVFFSMDLLERGLKDVLAGGKPAERDLIIKVGMDVASALQFAHTHEGGIVHRDLKPDNILFDRHGNAVVTDFGIAEAATNYTSATGTTVYVGTPKYMSPEQARGQRVDHRSDIYSLGVTLYELATGDAPFTGRDWFELGRKHIEQLPPLPREKNPALDSHLELIILKCLQKSPVDRYQTAEQLRADLAALAGGTPPSISRGAVGTGRPRPSGAREVTPRPRSVETGAPPELHEATTRPPARRRGRYIAPLALAVILAGVATAYAYDVAELRTEAEQRFPLLSALPYLGSGRVYPTAFWFTTIEGGADIEPRLDVRFTAPIDPATANSANVDLIGPAGHPVPVEILLADGGRRISVRPTRRLDYQTDYTLRISPGLLSAAGSPILQNARATEPGASFEFRTRLAPPDIEAPSLAGSSPAKNALGVPPGAPITIRFSEAIDPATLNPETLALQNAEGETVDIRIFAAEDGLSAQVQPAGELQRGVRYALVLRPGIADTAGNSIAADTVAFTTGSGNASLGTSRISTLSVRVRPAPASSLVRLVIDGRDTVDVPSLNRRLEPGQHRIELLASPPYSAYHLPLHEETFTLVPGQTREIEQQLRPFGWITVTSEPVADVFVDGKFVASTPLAGYALPSGPHSLELRPTAESVGRSGVYSSQVDVPRFQELNLGRVRLPPPR